MMPPAQAASRMVQPPIGWLTSTVRAACWQPIFLTRYGVLLTRK